MTPFHKDHLEVCLPNSRLSSGLIGMWFSMKISLLIVRSQYDIKISILYLIPRTRAYKKIVKANVLANVDKSHKSSIDLSICMTNAIHYC